MRIKVTVDNVAKRMLHAVCALPTDAIVLKERTWTAASTPAKVPQTDAPPQSRQRCF